MPTIEPGATLYVVMGTTGDYSDRTEWPVLAFTDEAKARTLVVLATERATQIEQTRRRVVLNRDINEYDPNMRMDGETRYFVMPVQLAPEARAQEPVEENTRSLWDAVLDD